MTKKSITLYTATSIVIANMIGTGVFTSLGFQVMGIKSVFALLMLWIIGGVAALCGALAYGELGAAMPRSGGEYNYLSKIYHPAVGFLSGWVSATVGFAAPIALAAMALGRYASTVSTVIPPVWLAAATVVILTLIHSSNLKAGSKFQDTFTTINILLIIIFIFSGFIFGQSQHIHLLPTTSAVKEIFSKEFAISLFFVSYSYSGWNAAAYLAGEINEPQKNLPRSLLRGTLLVALLYIVLNAVFLYTTPIAELSGQVEVGAIVATKIFGTIGGKIMGMLISLLLISSVSSMIMAGPRVSQVMGEDLLLLKRFAQKNKKGIPFFAIIVQGCVALLLIFTSTFEQVITYIGFTLNLFTFMTVLGMVILRIKKPDLPRPYKTYGYPYTSIIFLLIGLWILVYGVIYKPYESLAGFLTVLSGLIVYFSGRKKELTTDSSLRSE